MAATTYEWRAYKLGVLRAAQFVANGHGEDSIASEMIAKLLDGESASGLQRLARREEVAFPRGFWRDVERWQQR